MADYPELADYVATAFLQGGMSQKAAGAGMRFNDVADALREPVSTVVNVHSTLAVAEAEARYRDQLAVLAAESTVDAALIGMEVTEQVTAALNDEVQSLRKMVKSLKDAARSAERGFTERITADKMIVPFDPIEFQLQRREQRRAPRINGYDHIEEE